MRLPLLTCLISTLVWTAGQAQNLNWETKIQFASYSLDAVELLPNDKAYAVGSQTSGDLVVNAVLRSDDAGASWAPVDLPAHDEALVDGAFIDVGRGAVLAEDYTLFALADGGPDWAQRSVPLSGEATTLAYFNDRMLVALGSDNRNYAAQVAVSFNEGDSWRNLSFGDSTYALEAVHFLDSLTGWVGGAHRRGLEPVVYHTTDGGTSWTEQRLPNTDGEFGTVNGIYFTDALNGRAVLTSLYHVGYSYITSDGGQTWQEDYNTGLPYNELAMQPDGRVAFLSAHYSPAQAVLSVSEDGGASWRTVRLDVSTYSRALDFDGDDILIGQNYSSIAYSGDAGRTVLQSQYAATIEDVLWRDSLTAHAVSGYVVGGPPRTFTTTDGGATWLADNVVPGGKSIQQLGDTLWVFFQGRDAYIERSTDGGATWRRFDIGGTEWLEDVTFLNHEFGLAHGANGYLRFTSDGGRSWRNLGSGTFDFIEELAMAGDRVVIAGGFGGSNGFINYSNNNGLMWTQAQLPIDNMVLGLDFGSDDVGLATTYNGPVLRTVNGGETWTEVGTIPHEQPQVVIMLDELHAYAGARERSGGSAEFTGQGYVYETTDGGLSWQLLYEREMPNSSISALAIQPNEEGTLWASGQQTWLARGTQQPVSVRDQAIEPGSMQLAPNPSTGPLNLSFSLQRAAVVHLEVHDVLGRTVYRQALGQLQGGEYRRELDLTLSAGQYVVTLIEAGGSHSSLLSITE